MIKESQLTTLLLLVLVGFLVYNLTAPVDLKNEGALEKLSDTEEQQEETEVDQREEDDEEELVEADEAEEEVVEKQVRQEAREPGDVSRMHSFRGLETGEEQAPLEGAFERPIEPQKQKPEEIDFNKNVVKKYDSKDYLPREVNDEWFDTDFSKAKVDSKDDKMIPTNRYVIGVNTVGQSLKNASYDIRGTIPNPKYTVSPWNNSTYEPDYNIKPLC
jgi:hypothetical protein